ncbi:MAG: ATP-binding protein [Lachnospiraceae bacterium]|nr:ATP-binding protein [Lachnospiraceae bacterium]
MSRKAETAGNRMPGSVSLRRLLTLSLLGLGLLPPVLLWLFWPTEYPAGSFISRRVMLILALILILVATAAVLLARILVRPIERLSSAMEDVREGYTSALSSHSVYRETDGIEKAFTSMFARMRVQEELRQEFISNVSHELKTPMTSMKVLADSLITQGEAAPEVYREFLADIGQEIDRENAIIADLTSLSNLDRKGVQMNISEVDMNALLETILKRVQPLAMKRDIALTLYSERPVTAHVDEVKITMALTNLVENAIKYNREHGSVAVRLNADHRSMTITIADTGIGIPEEALDRIFERFYRVDKSRAREVGGTGLGLSLARSVITLHRGTVSVVSEVGEGSEFTVMLPLKYGVKNAAI